MHRLAEMLSDAADGRFPPVDGAFEVLPPARPGHLAIVEFTGHTVVLADVDPVALAELGADGFGGASHPDVKRFLAGDTGTIGSHDALLFGRGVGTVDESGLRHRGDLDDHPRVVRSRHHRLDVEVLADETGVATLGRGLVDRLELSVELIGVEHGAGAGRRLIGAALEVLPQGQVVWAQVAPGNAASLRAFLSCGFVPVGAETLIVI